MSISKTIARNTVFNGLGRLWDAALSLILTAYIIFEIGVAEYGLWGIVAAFTGYAALFDLGVGSAYTKYIAEYAARKDRESISSVVSTGFFVYLVFGGFFVLGGWALADIAVDFASRLNPETAGDLGRQEVIGDFRFLLRWGLVLFALSNCITPFTAVQTGLQRMGVTNVISAVSTVVKVIATVAFLELGYGVRGLLFSNAVVLGFFGIASMATAFWLLPGLRVSPKRVARSTFSKLFQFGWRAQVSRLANLIMFETDVLVIAIVLRNLELAGLYKIGVELANKMRQVPGVLLSALIPAASTLDAQGDQEKLEELYIRSTKYVAALTFPLVALLAGAAGLFMEGWIGPVADVAIAVAVLRIMACGYLANILPGAGVTVALGKGRADIQMKAGLISMVSNVALTLLLVYSVGFWGIPVATAISMALSWGWFAHAMGPVAGAGPVRLFASAVGRPLLASLPGAGLCILVDALAADVTGRALALAILAPLALVLFFVYAMGLRKTGFFDTYDADFLGHTLKLERVPGFAFWVRGTRQA